jgi:hypothetical protein
MRRSQSALVGPRGMRQPAPESHVQGQAVVLLADDVGSNAFNRPLLDSFWKLFSQHANLCLGKRFEAVQDPENPGVNFLPFANALPRLLH